MAETGAVPCWGLAMGSRQNLGCIGASAILLWSAQPAIAAAWTQDRGKGQIITTFTFDFASGAFNEAGQIEATPLFQKYEFKALAEYGVTDWLTAKLSPGYEMVVTEFDGARVDENGLNHMGLGARWRMFKLGNHVFSAEGMYFWKGNLETTATTVVSRGEGDVEARLLYGGSKTFKFRKKKWPAFWNVEMAYRLRDGEPADEYHLDLTVGLQLRKKWQMLGQSFNIMSDGPGEDRIDAVFPQYRLHKAQFSGVYRLNDHIRLQMGSFQTIAGQNIVAETAAFGAVWLDF